jgi:predicted DNA-binding transcriptional regulator YafY
VDAVQSSKFITLKKSNQLIKKLESLTSHYEATQLQREVYVSNRLKTINESIYYNVDQIHTAMGKNVQIRFQYYQWTLKKQMELKKNGDYYCISPWGLSWDDENYYMIGFDADAGQVKHYRVDKMLHIELTDIPREGQKHFDGLDMAQYARKMFGMFQGKEQLVRLECKNSMIGVILDRFGKDVQIIRKDEEHFTVNVNVVVSNQFFGWVIGLGDGVRITGPEMVVNRMKEIAGEMMKSYLNNGDN